jgi:DNA polymerase-3 subunit beta
MHISVVKSDLVRCLQLASTFPERDAPNPVLKNTLLSIVDAGDRHLLRVIASDLRQTLISHAPCTAMETGSLALSAKTLSEVVGTLPEGPVELRVDGTRLVVGSGRRASKLPFEVGENFPAMPQIDESLQPVVIDASALVSLIDRVYRCTVADASKPAVMCSVVLDIGGGEARAVALDGVTLGFARDGYNGASGLSVVVPISGARRLLAALKDYTGAVSIAYSKRQTDSANEVTELVVQFGSTQLTTKRLNRDDYPQFEQVLDTERPHALKLSRKALVSSCEAVAKVLDREEYAKVVLELAAGELTLTTQSSTGRAANDTIEGIEHDAPLRWAMNLHNILDVLVPLNSDLVEIRYENVLRPFAFSAPGNDSYIALVSPCELR